MYKYFILTYIHAIHRHANFPPQSPTFPTMQCIFLKMFYIEEVFQFAFNTCELEHEELYVLTPVESIVL